MKNKDVQKVILSKYERSDGTMKIFQDLNGTISLPTIERWCRGIRESGSISLFKLPDRSKIIRAKGAIEKVKARSNRRSLVHFENFLVNRSSVQKILKNDLKLQAKMNQCSQMSIK